MNPQEQEELTKKIILILEGICNHTRSLKKIEDEYGEDFLSNLYLNDHRIKKLIRELEELY